MYIQLDDSGNVTGVFNNPQSDAVDNDGNVVSGVSTVKVDDNDSRILDYGKLTLDTQLNQVSLSSTETLSVEALIADPVALATLKTALGI